jgi:hypothetical protein
LGVPGKRLGRGWPVFSSLSPAIRHFAAPALGFGVEADLRPFFKKHSLAKQGVEVFLIDRKREVVTARPGDDFLYGGRLPPDFPADLYRRKWQRRSREEPDDGTAAPGSWSSFLWEGIEPGLVPWGC